MAFGGPEFGPILDSAAFWQLELHPHCFLPIAKFKSLSLLPWTSTCSLFLWSFTLWCSQSLLLKYLGLLSHCTALLKNVIIPHLSSPHAPKWAWTQQKALWALVLASKQPLPPGSQLADQLVGSSLVSWDASHLPGAVFAYLSSGFSCTALLTSQHPSSCSVFQFWLVPRWFETISNLHLVNLFPHYTGAACLLDCLSMEPPVDRR